MDTSTHIIMGFGLAGLSFIDPAVSSNPELAQAILLGTVIGSNAPDFDYAIKLVKGRGMYTEHHRGLSHSIPALFIWTLFVAGIIYLFFRDVSFLPLLYWTFISVVIHVGFDILNPYGTQAGRPFTKNWLSLNFIPLFDPIIIFIHLIGFILWLIGYPPGIVFSCGYLVLLLYVAMRYLVYKQKRSFVMKNTQKRGNITFIPTMWLHKWDFVFETDSAYHVGFVNGNKINLFQHFVRHDPNAQLIKASLQDKNVQHFIANSKHTHAISYHSLSGFEVHWIDLRFRHKDRFPYMAIVKFNREQTIIHSSTGWMHNIKNRNEKLPSNQNRALER
ncbi:metal-dependent hydrolase [Metabacillus sediminilitoris]|nr:metal-dependent hydrolase [Metabacillus sediminilitoris]